MWRGWKMTGFLKGHRYHEGLRKRGLDVRQARRKVHDRSVWQEFVRGNAWDIA